MDKETYISGPGLYRDEVVVPINRGAQYRPANRIDNP